MKLIALLLMLTMLCGCSLSGVRAALATPGGFAPRATLEEQKTINAELDTQLGLLVRHITPGERTAALEIWEKLRPMRADRLESGKYQQSDRETRLLQRLNTLYEDYTIKYLGGDNGGWGYTNPDERILGEFTVKDGETLSLSGPLNVANTQWTERDLLDLWERMLAMLPDGAFDDFTRLTIFSDGEDETMAFVQYLDDKGTRWEIAVDPADADDGDVFLETILHEYCHYITLNDEQVDYTQHQTVNTYNEDGMVSDTGSYIDDFYQRFWGGYLEDRRANMESYNFFLRHDNDFIDPYASTDPSEDICESFTFFILREAPVGDAVWQQKLRFFYDYPELVDFRNQVRDNQKTTEGDRAA